MQKNSTYLFLGLSAALVLPACSGDDGRPAESDTADSMTGLTSATDGTASGTTGTSGGTTDSSSVTDSGSDTGTTTAGSDTDMDCGEAMITPMAVPPNVVLVLDKSGSMISNMWDPAGGNADCSDVNNPDPGCVTRWESLHNVVTFITTNFDEQINFGAQLFPSTAALAQYSDAACTTQAAPEVAVMSMGGAAVVSGIPAADDVSLAGGTPATAGMTSAVDHLKTLDSEISRVVILVTDGAANCAGATIAEKMENFDTNLATVVGDAFTTDEIPTYVIGIDMGDEIVGCGGGGLCGQCSDDMALCSNDAGCMAMASCDPTDVQVDGQPLANPWKELNTVAVAGGVPKNMGMDAEKFFNAGNEMELQLALEAIAGAVIDCTIPLDPPPTDKQKNYVEIDIGGMSWDQVTDCATEDGWLYSSLPELTEITLCGAACDAFKDAKGALDATYGCPPAG